MKFGFYLALILVTLSLPADAAEKRDLQLELVKVAASQEPFLVKKAKIEELIKDGADIHGEYKASGQFSGLGALFGVIDMPGVTALIAAAKVGDLETVKYLVEEKGAHPLQMGSESSHSHMLPSDSSFDVVSVYDYKSKLYMEEAVAEKRVADILEVLIKAVIPKIVESQGIAGLTKPIFIDNENLVQLAALRSERGLFALLAAGADPNVFYDNKDADFKSFEEHSWPALLTAAHYARTSSLNALLVAGADPNLTNHKGASPIIVVNTALLSKPFDQRMVINRLLVQYGADVNAQTLNGKTALMNAAYSLDIESVKFLLENGAQLDLIHVDRVSGGPSDGKIIEMSTALTHAITAGGDAGIKEEPYERTAEYEMRREQRSIQRKEVQMEIIKLLLAAGADPRVGVKWDKNNFALAESLPKNLKQLIEEVEAEKLASCEKLLN